MIINEALPLVEAFNCEEIPGCLASVTPTADEIVVRGPVGELRIWISVTSRATATERLRGYAVLARERIFGGSR